MAKHISIQLALFAAAMLMGTIGYAQTIESVTFSAVASGNDNFQQVMGTPYGASLSGANGSLEISASYGEGTYEETVLTAEELNLQSIIRVYPNPTSYMVDVDLSRLPQGEYQLYLLDLSGKVVYEQMTPGPNEQIDMYSLATGTYVLGVQAEDTRKLGTFNIVKTK